MAKGQRYHSASEVALPVAQGLKCVFKSTGSHPGLSSGLP